MFDPAVTVVGLIAYVPTHVFLSDCQLPVTACAPGLMTTLGWIEVAISRLNTSVTVNVPAPKFPFAFAFVLESPTVTVGV